MNVAFHTPILSPHQVPWCRRFVAAFPKVRFVTVVQNADDAEREKLGWSIRDCGFQILLSENSAGELEFCDVLISGVRDAGLFERRLSAGRLTLYMSERWFKPPFGMLRLLYPPYFAMAGRIAGLIGAPNFIYLPIGKYAVRDMLRLVGFFKYGWLNLFRIPRFCFVSQPMGAIAVEGELSGEKKPWDGMRMWGYFVESSDFSPKTSTEQKNGNVLNLLWVGRMLSWKRVDTLVKAVTELLQAGESIRLRLVGSGPEEARLRKLAGSWLVEDEFPTSALDGHLVGQDKGISFSPPVPIAEVRVLMRQADVYVLSSNGYEGWGAVVNEAMEEGCCVISTREAGSSATMIEDDLNGLLFDCGDRQELIACLRKTAHPEIRGRLAAAAKQTIETVWSSQNAALSLGDVIGSILAEGDLYFPLQVQSGE